MATTLVNAERARSAGFTNDLPVLGASISADKLPAHAEWLIAEQRDMEMPEPARHPLLSLDEWRDRVRVTQELLRDHTGRVGIHGPYDGLVFNSFDVEVRELATRHLLQGLDYGDVLGASHMVIHSPFSGFGSPFVGLSAAGWNFERQLDAIHQTLDPVVRQAEANGCALVIETCRDLHPAPLIELVRSFDSEFVQVSIDVGHAFIMSQYGGAPPDQWIREAGSLLGHLHLQDTDGQYDRHWAPGDGVISWYGIFQALATLSHKPRLILEPINKDLVPRGAAYLASQGLAI